MRRRRFIAALAALGASLLGGCTGAPVPTITASGTVKESVTGKPLAGVTVAEVGGMSVTTGADGRFQSILTPGQTAWALEAAKPGYAPSVARLEVPEIPSTGLQLDIPMTLVPVQALALLDPRVGGSLSVESAAEVVFPPNAFVSKDGSSLPSGMISVTVAPIDPFNPDELGAFPRGFEAIRFSGKGGILTKSYAVVDISATAGGQPLTLAPGATASVVFIGDNKRVESETIPTWSLDSATGIWREEGIATRGVRDGKQVYVAQVTHLSWWQAADWSDVVYVEGTLTTDDAALVNADGSLALANPGDLHLYVRSGILGTATDAQLLRPHFREEARPGDALVIVAQGVLGGRQVASAPISVTTPATGTVDLGNIKLVAILSTCPGLPPAKLCNGECLDALLPCGAVAPSAYCTVDNGGCDAERICSMRNGFRTCSAAPRVDDCLADAGCDDHASCTDGPGRRVCVCNSGFVGDGKTCTDIDECPTNNGGCDVNATCTNSVGGRTCACNAGFAGNGSTCTDIDECATANGGCDTNASCTNSVGSRTCVCNAGFAGNGDLCTDIDECQVSNGGCDPNATCTNLSGASACTCNAGFSGDGRSCADINECAEGTAHCAVDAVCINTAGSFTCGTCPPGYSNGGVIDGVIQCDDIDECANGFDNCGEHAQCDNKPGSFTCSCAEGYFGDGLICRACGTCQTGTYPAKACSATEDVVCAACDGCPNGQYQVSACTTTPQPVCAPCTSCSHGAYQERACSARTDAVCTPCTKHCSPGTYIASACTETEDLSCRSCSPIANCAGAVSCTNSGTQQCSACNDGFYRVDDIADTCVACSTCNAGTYLAMACSDTADAICMGCTTIANCTGTLSCTGATDQQCSACAATFYRVDGPADSCAACTICSPGTYQTTPCSETTDTGCSSCTAIANCTGVVSCTNASDQQCSACGNGFYRNDGTADTCETCTTCGSGTYQTTACSEAADTACSNCTAIDHCAGTISCTTATDQQCSVCSSGYYRLDDTADTCVACTMCGAGTYTATTCSATSDATCSSCTSIDNCSGTLSCTSTTDQQCSACSSGYYRVDDTADTCHVCSVCGAGQYVVSACSGTADTVCGDCTAIANCSDGGLTCTGPTDSQCSACAAEYYRVDGAVDSCAMCTPTCGAGYYESSACAGAQDRVCETCDASCATCDGPTNDDCTSCGSGMVLEP